MGRVEMGWANVEAADRRCPGARRRGPTLACDSGATCTLATNTTSYPYTLPAGTTAPTATKLVDTSANTGLGDQTATPTWKP